LSLPLARPAPWPSGPQRLTKSDTKTAAASNTDSETGPDSESGGGAPELPELLTITRVECRCDLRSKKRTLERVAALLMDAFDDEELSDMHVLDALINRERLGSTGIGDGVALPHARMPSLTEPAAVMISLKTGVDYDSVDGQKVDLIVGLLVPEDCNDAHLKILRALAIRFSNTDYRDALRGATTNKELFTQAVQPIDSL